MASQIVAIDELHDQIGRGPAVFGSAAGFPGIEGQHNVGMVQFGLAAHLGIETLEQAGVALFIDRQYLDRDPGA